MKVFVRKKMLGIFWNARICIEVFRVSAKTCKILLVISRNIKISKYFSFTTKYFFYLKIIRFRPFLFQKHVHEEIIRFLLMCPLRHRRGGGLRTFFMDDSLFCSQFSITLWGGTEEFLLFLLYFLIVFSQQFGLQEKSFIPKS